MKFIWASGKEKDIWVGAHFSDIKMIRDFYYPPRDILFSISDVQWMMSLSEGLFWLHCGHLISCLTMESQKKMSQLRFELAKLRGDDHGKS